MQNVKLLVIVTLVISVLGSVFASQAKAGGFEPDPSDPPVITVGSGTR